MVSPELSESVSSYLQRQREGVAQVKLEAVQYYERRRDISNASWDLKYFLVSLSGGKDIVAFPAQEDKTTRLNALETLHIRDHDLYRVVIAEQLIDTLPIAGEVLHYEEDEEVLSKAVEVALSNLDKLRSSYGNGEFPAALISSLHTQLIQRFSDNWDSIEEHLKDRGDLLDRLRVIIIEPALS